MYTALEKAIADEESRRKTSYQEVQALEELVRSLDKDILNKTDVISITSSDRQNIIALNQDIASFLLHPALKYNKLLDIFACSAEIFEQNFEFAIAGNLTQSLPFNANRRTILYGTKDTEGRIINYFGTSKLNCIQNAYFTVLRSVNSITSITDLLRYNIYDVNTSSNLQTTVLPKNFNNTKYKKWFYYYEDKQSPQQGELLTPNLGYIFGGSRNDLRYINKLFRAQDCSSAVAKWTNSKQAFATKHLLELYNGDKNCDNDNLCAAAKEVLTPLKININEAYAGLVFSYAKGGHAGLVTGNYPEEQLLETLSYNRNMPELEGLGYYNYSYIDKDLIFFQTKSVDLHDEL